MAAVRDQEHNAHWECPGSSTSEKRDCFALSRRRYEAHALDPNSQMAKLTTRVTKGNEKLEWILGLYMSE